MATRDQSGNYVVDAELKAPPNGGQWLLQAKLVGIGVLSEQPLTIVDTAP